jgi:hypothetical protein
LQKKINADERATDRFMNALVAIGFLRKVHGKFYNTESASQYLVKGKPEFMGGLFHTNELWRRWSTLTKAVKNGTAVYDENDASDNSLEYFIEAMHYRAVKEAKIISLMIDLNGVNKMLDIGGRVRVLSQCSSSKKSRYMCCCVPTCKILFLLQKNMSIHLNIKIKINYITGDLPPKRFWCRLRYDILSAIVHINTLRR